jgi:hypothetical protein
MRGQVGPSVNGIATRPPSNAKDRTVAMQDFLTEAPLATLESPSNQTTEGSGNNKRVALSRDMRDADHVMTVHTQTNAGLLHGDYLHHIQNVNIAAGVK